jgi:ABC-type Fe3+/spermidine/putrescine transport system ATPase subunit
MQNSDIDVEFRGVRKFYGNHEVLKGISISIRRGELLTLLGPSGCGKTTLLRILAGFVRPTEGGVWLGGDCVTDVPPAKRNVGMVFQNYSLFPHMSVYDNVAFGLRMRRMDKATTDRRVDEALALVHLHEYKKAYPTQLSGGMQQRIALARVLAIRPRALLLDEPFGAIDRRLRDEMQVEVRKLQQQLGITTLFVTHDQQEALIMSDRIVVMNYGNVEQEGMPLSIYDSPRTRFVAGFLGTDNLIPVRLIEVREGLGIVRMTENAGFAVPTKTQLKGSSAILAFRAECVSLSPPEAKPAQECPPAETPPRMLSVPGTVEFVTNLGSRIIYEIKLKDGPTIVAEAQRTDSTLCFSIGGPLIVTLRGDQCALLSEE